MLTVGSETLLSELYLKTLQELSGRKNPAATNLASLRADNATAVRRQLEGQLPSEWISLQLMHGRSARRIDAGGTHCGHLQWVWGSPRPVLVDTEYEAAADDRVHGVYRTLLTPGIFSKIAGFWRRRGCRFSMPKCYVQTYCHDSFRGQMGTTRSGPLRIVLMTFGRKS